MDDIFAKYFNADKISHAYLLNTNDVQKVIELAKYIFHLSDVTDNINNLIDNNIYPDLRIIKPDGQWIKKEQILELQEEYKVRSIYNNKRIYIINNAENLNKSSGNTLLKFLEEPNPEIVALLITNNKNKVLPTIVSRCQYISLDSNSETVPIDLDDALDCCLIIEKDKQLANLQLVQKINMYEDRLKIKELFSQMTLIYEKRLLEKYNIDNKLTIDETKFDKIAKNNTIEEVIKKMQSLIFFIDAMDYNVNIKLLVDKLLIMMYGVD